MVLERFHPSVASWFSKEFEQPTEIQTKAWPEIRKRRNLLISAPTGSGNQGQTLFAFMKSVCPWFLRTYSVRKVIK